MANLSEEMDTIDNDSYDSIEDELTKKLIEWDEQRAIAYLTRLGYEVRKITGYDR